ncbi:MAG: hypothetical protein AAGB16_10815, partial [Pseudomonadota bacterium]
MAMRGLVAYLLKHRQLTALGGATVLHVLILGLIVSLPRSGPTYETAQPIIVTLYEAPLEEEPPIPSQPPEPEPEIEPIESPPLPEPEVSAAIVQPPSAIVGLTESPDPAEIIVQPPTVPEAANSSAAETSPEPADARTLAANILNRADCNRLTRKRPEDCPREDQFPSLKIPDRATHVAIPTFNADAYGPQT